MRNADGFRFDMIERLFFAYRDFTRDPDIVLQEYGFGRAHHRVLYFVNRTPGIRVADLLTTLNITKQSLARVLKQLIDTDFIVQNTSSLDRRERLLYPTEKGRNLAIELSRSQSRRIESALDDLGPAGADAAKRFLYLLINEADKETVERLEEI
ncbi:MAG: MarR family transcriptional regulator [Pseudomonadota bacterium]